MKTASRIMTSIIALSLLTLAVPTVALADQGRGRRLEVDVAEDGTRFVFDENGPLLENGYPDYGNGFVTQGYIYPAGTLTDTNGVTADGSPEFPDLVIGEWTCYGYFIGDGADTTEGAWVVTTQVFEFHGDVPGAETIVTVGSETPAGAGPAFRAVVGGTGAYATAAGQLEQVTLGHNLSEGVNATFVFELHGVTGTAGVRSAPSRTDRPLYL
jgi:hypothetical protein